MKKNNTILKIFPHFISISKNQNASIWLVVKENIYYSRYKNNFKIISPNSDNPLNNYDTEIIYIKQETNKENFSNNFHTNNNISQQNYIKNILQLVNTLCPSLIEVELDYRLAGKLAKLLPNIPVIFVSHVIFAKRKFLPRLIQYIKYLRYITHIIFVSNSHRNIFLKKFPYSNIKNSVIHNSYAHIKLPDINFNNKKNQVIFAGRAKDYKGYKEYLEALYDFLPKHNNWKGLAALSIEYKENQIELNKIINDLNLQNLINNKQLEILINTPNYELIKLFAESKIAIFPTKPCFIEGLPLVGIEAHLTECAVISSKNPGFIELSSNNILYLNEVTKNEIINKLTTLVNNPNLLEQYAKNGKQHILNNYKVTNFIKSYDQVREKYLKK